MERAEDLDIQRCVRAVQVRAAGEPASSSRGADERAGAVRTCGALEGERQPEVRKLRDLDSNQGPFG